MNYIEYYSRIEDESFIGNRDFKVYTRKDNGFIAFVKSKYKFFGDLRISFGKDESFNCIIGRNNSGKSFLLYNIFNTITKMNYNYYYGTINNTSYHYLDYFNILFRDINRDYIASFKVLFKCIILGKKIFEYDYKKHLNKDEEEYFFKLRWDKFVDLLNKFPLIERSGLVFYKYDERKEVDYGYRTEYDVLYQNKEFDNNKYKKYGLMRDDYYFEESIKNIPNSIKYLLYILLYTTFVSNDSDYRVIFIDDVEYNLDIDNQYILYQVLSEDFPNTQFICTTKSQYMCMGCEKGSIHLINRGYEFFPDFIDRYVTKLEGESKDRVLYSSILESTSSAQLWFDNSCSKSVKGKLLYTEMDELYKKSLDGEASDDEEDKLMWLKGVFSCG